MLDFGLNRLLKVGALKATSGCFARRTASLNRLLKVGALKGFFTEPDPFYAQSQSPSESRRTERGSRHAEQRDRGLNRLLKVGALKGTPQGVSPSVLGLNRLLKVGALKDFGKESLAWVIWSLNRLLKVGALKALGPDGDRQSQGLVSIAF